MSNPVITGHLKEKTRAIEGLFSQPGATAIEANALWKSYSESSVKVDILKGLDLKVERGEILAILGPSGAGKTTLLNTLSGMDQPTAGEIQVLGQKMYELSEGNRAKLMNQKIGFVFQFYHLIQDLTVLENVMLPQLIRPGLPRKVMRLRAIALLEEMKLASHQNKFPAQLSGGEKQRVAIARSVMNEPEILFCDEPTGNLDTRTGSETQEFLFRLANKHHKTVLIVTHDDRIAQNASRVLKLRDGQWA